MQEILQSVAATTQTVSQLVILIGQPDHIRRLEPMLKEHVRKIAFIHPEKLSGASGQKTSFDLDAVTHTATENFKEGFEIVFCSGFPPDTKALEHVMEIFDRVLIFSVETNPDMYARQMSLSSHEWKRLVEVIRAREMQMSGFIDYVGRQHKHRFDAVHHKRSLHVQAVHIANKILAKMGRKLIPAS